MNWLLMGLYHAAAMFWATLWALVFGFALSGALQTLVSQGRMARLFGKTNFRSLALATGFGAASSSCSYAATAAARSAFVQGAALVPALAFMFAATNLVVELGAVLWIFLGPTFVLAEVVGALFLVGSVWFYGKLLLPPQVERAARAHTAGSEEAGGCCHHHHHDGAGHGHDDGHHDADERSHTSSSGSDRLRALAHAFVADWSMLWKEMAVGFLIAGFLATLVPADWWKDLFLQGGPAPVRALENVVVGPLIAVASFVCSVGNIPLASLLWSGGISFGGVISFIYADLLVVPLLLIYRKQYGLGPAVRIALTLFLSIVTAGLLVDGIFHALGLVPAGPRPVNAAEHASFSWNHTTWLNFAALVVAAFLVYLHRRPAAPGTGAGSTSAAEPPHHHHAH